MLRLVPKFFANRKNGGITKEDVLETFSVKYLFKKLHFKPSNASAEDRARTIDAAWEQDPSVFIDMLLEERSMSEARHAASLRTISHFEADIPDGSADFSSTFVIASLVLPYVTSAADMWALYRTNTHLATTLARKAIPSIAQLDCRNFKSFVMQKLHFFRVRRVMDLRKVSPFKSDLFDLHSVVFKVDAHIRTKDINSIVAPNLTYLCLPCGFSWKPETRLPSSVRNLDIPEVNDNFAPTPDTLPASLRRLTMSLLVRRPGRAYADLPQHESTWLPASVRELDLGGVRPRGTIPAGVSVLRLLVTWDDFAMPLFDDGSALQVLVMRMAKCAAGSVMGRSMPRGLVHLTIERLTRRDRDAHAENNRILFDVVGLPHSIQMIAIANISMRDSTPRAITALPRVILHEGLRVFTVDNVLTLGEIELPASLEILKIRDVSNQLIRKASPLVNLRFVKVRSSRAIDPSDWYHILGESMEPVRSGFISMVANAEVGHGESVYKLPMFNTIHSEDGHIIHTIVYRRRQTANNM